MTESAKRDALTVLHAGLARRATPETVGAELKDLLELTLAERRLFPSRPSWWGSSVSSMGDDWTKPTDLSKQLTVLEDLVAKTLPEIALSPGIILADDPLSIRTRLDVVMRVLGMRPGRTSFKGHRANRSERERMGLDMSRRRYDKLFRLVGRIDGYINELSDQQDLFYLTRFAKVGLGADIPLSRFLVSESSAAFAAYHVANLGRRSLFTSGPQARAFDEVAEMLLRRAEADPTTDWFVIAHTFPRADVLARLTLDERAELLDRATRVLAECAERLRKISASQGEALDLTRMVVHRGNDSSTWNAVAGAWNKARDLWVACAWALDASIIEAYLPGKLLRLMAADVVYAMHRGKLDPDTKVWGDLPRPWLVFSGQATCTRDLVIRACEKNGVDPEKSGWAKPRPRTEVAQVVATPESVHGVVVSHPFLADILRRSGWFSGYEKRLKEVSPAIVAAGVTDLIAHHEVHGAKLTNGQAADLGVALPGVDFPYSADPDAEYDDELEMPSPRTPA